MAALRHDASPPREGRGHAECSWPWAGRAALQVGRKISRMSRMGGCDRIYHLPLLSLCPFLVCPPQPGVECCHVFWIKTGTRKQIKARFNVFSVLRTTPGKAALGLVETLSLSSPEQATVQQRHQRAAVNTQGEAVGKLRKGLPVAQHWSLFCRTSHVSKFNYFSRLRARTCSGAAALSSQVHGQGGDVRLDSSTHRLLAGSSQRGLLAVSLVSPVPWEIHGPQKS